MSTQASDRRSRWQRGAAAVEMAILFPLLFLILAGIVDFGRFFFESIQVANAAREGARAAIVSPADVTARVEAAAPGFTGLIIDPGPACTAGGVATVKVSNPSFQWILLGPAMSLFGSTGISKTPTSTAVMRCGG